MPVPKKRTSLSKRKLRRMHDKLSPTFAVVCSNCGQSTLRHRVCPSCGQYRGKQIAPVVQEQEQAAS